MRLALACLVSLSLVFVSITAASPPVKAEGCQFVLGFKALHDLIPSTVGDCVTDEYHNPANGDGLQETVGGLLVWRKADNWTAFTDGYRTWINGPYGLQQRLNTERFSWEVDLTGFTGEWGRHGASLVVRGDGSAEAIWRTYNWCGSEADTACDRMQDDGTIVPGGRAALVFSSAQGSTAGGQVLSSTDEESLPVGPVSLTVRQNGTAVLTDRYGNQTVLCGQGAWADECGA